jgi:hypothetical protein
LQINKDFVVKNTPGTDFNAESLELMRADIPLLDRPSMTDDNFGTGALNWGMFFPREEGKMGEFLKRSGRPLACRLDVRLTRLEELKKACVLISELNKSIQYLAYQAEGDPVLRVMLARNIFATAQVKLKYYRTEDVIRKKEGGGKKGASPSKEGFKGLKSEAP